MLARELQRSTADIFQAFARYESRMRPYVELNQALVDLERAGPVPMRSWTERKTPSYSTREALPGGLRLYPAASPK